MRILLVSDIHANWPALEAIDEPHDLCLCIGDLVDYCCEPGPVVEWVRRKASVCVRGNHDHMVAQNVATNGLAGYRYLSGVTRALSRERLDAAGIRYLAELPVTRYLTLDKKRFLLVHATPRDPLDEYAPAEVDFWKRRLEGVGVDVVVVGHTHQPYLLDAGGVMVINPGSVGLPRDRDPRASYALWEDGKVTLKRVAYDVERAVRNVEEAPLPDLAKLMLMQVLRHGSLNGPGKTNGNGGSNGMKLR
jgi:putative phosphoesterase